MLVLVIKINGGDTDDQQGSSYWRINPHPCVANACSYTLALFWPALEAIRLWLVAIPVFIAFIAILGIGAWIGWAMATTRPPKPIESIQTQEAS